MQEPLEIFTLASAPLQVHLHLWSGLAAVATGTLTMVMRKGTMRHKIMGRIWVGIMLTLALSSFFIQARDRFSMLHVFSLVVLFMLPAALIAARKGHIRFHRNTMVGVYSGLMIAGAFTLLPYRILGQLVFG